MKYTNYLSSALAFLLVFANNHCRGNNFKAYHARVNQAELKIIAKNYRDAFGLYQDAFRNNPAPFALDLYNATLCAIQVHRNNMALKWCRMLSDKGIPSYFFETKPELVSLKKSKAWKSLLSDADKKYRAVHARYAKLLHMIDSLVALDQKVNLEWREAGMSEQKRKIMDATYDTLSRALLDIFSEYGFLSENKIGVVLNSDTGLSYGFPFDVLIIHNFQSRYIGDTLFHATLMQALADGQVKPQYLARMEDHGGNNGSRPYFGSSKLYARYQCTLYRETHPWLNYEEIERQRESIGLFSLKDFEKKILFNIQHPAGNFLIDSYYTTYTNFLNKESEQTFLSNQTVIIPRIPNCN